VKKLHVPKGISGAGPDEHEEVLGGEDRDTSWVKLNPSLRRELHAPSCTTITLRPGPVGDKRSKFSI
jgi:hypothetical protein